MHLCLYTCRMSPSFYAGVDPYDSQVCAAVRVLGQEEADLRMTEHLDTWFTSADFDKLEAYGVKDIRIPVGQRIFLILRCVWS